MLIWRVEHPSDNIGPFIERDDVTYIDSRYGRFVLITPTRIVREPFTEEIHPPICKDERAYYLANQHGFVCGVESPEHLLLWFSDDMREALEEIGFVVRVFEVAEDDWEPVRTPNANPQVVFDRSDSRVELEIPLGELPQWI